MTTKRGEQEHSEASLSKERLQGAQEAVASEVAAAEPEMPPLLAEPAAEAVRVTVIKFEKYSRSTMATVPIMPAVSLDLASEKNLPAFASPPVFGGAARTFLNSAPGSAEYELLQNAEASEDADEERLGETTPNLSMAEEASEAFEEPLLVPKPRPHDAGASVKPNAPKLALQADAPTQPWLVAIHESETPPGEGVSPRKEEERGGGENRRPRTKQLSGWLVWSVAVGLSAIVASWVFFTYEAQQESSSIAALSPEKSAPSSKGAAMSPEKLAQAVPASPLDISDGMRLALAPSAAKPDANAPSEEAQTAAQEAPRASAEAPEGLAQAKEDLVELPTKAAAPTKAEYISKEERLFVEGLEAARKYAQKDQFTRALRELSKIHPQYKKYPTRVLEFEFLYAMSLVFTEGDSKQTLRALQMLESLRNPYKTNPDYWRASGFANQLLGMDEAIPIRERLKFLRQAKSDYTESLRLGRNNPKYTQARSYIEHIERDLRELMDDNAGD